MSGTSKLDDNCHSHHCHVTCLDHVTAQCSMLNFELGFIRVPKLGLSHHYIGACAKLRVQKLGLNPNPKLHWGQRLEAGLTS